MSLFPLLLPIGFLLAIARIARPTVQRPSGQLVLRYPLPLLARARLHAAPVSVLLALALVLLVLGGIPWWLFLGVLAALAGLIAWPLSYELTTTGIRLGHTGLRRWTEFAGVVRAPGGACLQRVGGGRGFRIWLSDSRGDDEFVYLLRRMIRRAYQGRQAFSPTSDLGTAEGLASRSGQTSDDAGPRSAAFASDVRGV